MRTSHTELTTVVLQSAFFRRETNETGCRELQASPIQTESSVHLRFSSTRHLARLSPRHTDVGAILTSIFRLSLHTSACFALLRSFHPVAVRHAFSCPAMLTLLRLLLHATTVCD